MLTLEVHTHSGLKCVIETDSYNAAELNEKINSNEVMTIVIGDHIFSRIDIKQIAPLKEAVTTE